VASKPPRAPVSAPAGGGNEFAFADDDRPARKRRDDDDDDRPARRSRRDDGEDDRPSRRRRDEDDDYDDRPRKKKRKSRYDDVESKRITAGILALLLGGFGVHKFYLGYTGAGIITIILVFCTGGLAGVIPFIEGILYLTKSDEDFIETYQIGQKEWF
jgi:TM2 domain-containing membrane protein YozV